MTSSTDRATAELVEHLFRHEAGRITARLTRVLGFEFIDLVEDVVQEALIKALKRWPFQGIPENPSGWLMTVAKNQALDVIRRHRSWQSKEKAIEETFWGSADNDPADHAALSNDIQDDQLKMIFACCHPLIPEDAQIALTLKAVGGFNVDEIAKAFLSRPTTIAQRIVRAKRKIKTHAIALNMPSEEALPQRLEQVLRVIYLMFNEGYSAHEGDRLIREDLCWEAVRLCDCLCAQPGTASPRAHALMALLLFQGSRLQTRADAEGDLVLLAEQDRTLWDRALIRRGVTHLHAAARGDEISLYHLEAEIAACHALAEDYDETDWERILDCYDHLYALNPSAVVAVNRVVAILKARGVAQAAANLKLLDGDRAVHDYYPYHITRAEVAIALGRHDAARASLQRALECTASVPVKRFLMRRLNTI